MSNTGGAAFAPRFSIPAFPRQSSDAIQAGMTLRDYFAAGAMAALYASQYEYEFTGAAREPECEVLMDELAQDAYQIADAMLRAREQK